MTRIRSDATIRRSPDQVFDYVTTPANWPRWHPSSMRVTGDAGHSQDVGERCTEEFVVAGRHGTCLWTVRERIPDERWVIDTTTRGGYARIEYRLAADGEGTQFTRTLSYRMPNALLGLLDVLYIRGRIERESALATTRLRERIESTATATTSGT